ncbi:hypothetical protein [Streptomyces sp. NPDC048516]|uniref:hypothetical protein n=1 Tax=Streptomyces sp. NPDC048516 TaxID=3365565 RepID=UPI0037136964
MNDHPAPHSLRPVRGAAGCAVAGFVVAGFVVRALTAVQQQRADHAPRFETAGTAAG